MFDINLTLELFEGQIQLWIDLYLENKENDMKDWAFFKYSRRKVKLILRKFSSQKKVLKFQLEVFPHCFSAPSLSRSAPCLCECMHSPYFAPSIQQLNLNIQGIKYAFEGDQITKYRIGIVAWKSLLVLFKLVRNLSQNSQSPEL